MAEYYPVDNATFRYPPPPVGSTMPAFTPPKSYHSGGRSPFQNNHMQNFSRPPPIAGPGSYSKGSNYPNYGTHPQFQPVPNSNINQQASIRVPCHPIDVSRPPPPIGNAQASMFALGTQMPSGGIPHSTLGTGFHNTGSSPIPHFVCTKVPPPPFTGPSKVDPAQNVGMCSSSTSSTPWHPLATSVLSSKKDQDWVDEWLKCKTAARSNGMPEVLTGCSFTNKVSTSAVNSSNINSRQTCSQYSNLKLSDVHRNVADFRQLVDKLKQSGGSGNSDNVTKLNELSAVLRDERYQAAVRRLVSFRRQKRMRQKQSRASRLQTWVQKSESIDRDREVKHSTEVEKRKREQLNKEADTVLQEVRQKTNEAQSLQELLDAFVDLRQHRLNKGELQGYVSSEEKDTQFNSFIDGLKEMLTNQLKEYNLEERTLQAMLDQHGSKSCETDTSFPSQSHSNFNNQKSSLGQNKEKPTTKTERKTTDKNTDHNEENMKRAASRLLFGTFTAPDDALLASYTAADNSVEMLCTRRQAWDQYLMTDGSGSGVPVGWVIPPQQPTAEWQLHLDSNKSTTIDD